MNQLSLKETLHSVSYETSIVTKTHKFYLKSSQHADDNYEPPRHKELDSQDEDEEEGEEEIPLPIPDQTRINLPIPSLEQDWSEQSSNNTRESLERHLQTIIEEAFRKRSQTPESQ